MYNLVNVVFIMTIRMAQRKHSDASQCYILSEQRNRRQPQGLGIRTAVRTTQWTQPTESTCSHKCREANAVAANNGNVLHNRPDAKASRLNVL
jgi:predicted nucleic acid-binding Zn ribbon protein